MKGWTHEVLIFLLGAAAFAVLAHVSSNAGWRAFENPDPHWFELLWPLWVLMAAAIPGILIGWNGQRRPYLLALGAYLLGGCSFYVSRYELIVQSTEYFPYHSALLQLLREALPFSLIGAAVAFVTHRVRRRLEKNAALSAENT